VTETATVVEVFADVACPFTHVGLRRLADRRDQFGRTDVVLRVRAWPLEHVNHAPLDGAFIAEEVDAIREQVAPDLFAGFAPDTFPSTSLPALALAAAAYRRGDIVGEAVSLELRDLCFEQGVDIADREVLDRVAAEHDLIVTDDDRASIEADHAEGGSRGVIGSPHFFTPEGSFFCPSLDVGRDGQGVLHVARNEAGLAAFLAACTLA
jgi:predicted DsbA family dithiol-disulfide isomerase